MLWRRRSKMSSTDINRKASSSQCSLQNWRHRSSRSASPMDRYGYVVIFNKSMVEDKSPLPRVNDLYAPVWQESHSRSWIWVMHIYNFRSTKGDYVTINTHKWFFRYIPGYRTGYQWRHPCSKERSRVCWLAFHACASSWTTFSSLGKPEKNLWRIFDLSWSSRAETEQSKVWVRQPVSRVPGPWYRSGRSSSNGRKGQGNSRCTQSNERERILSWLGLLNY